MMFTNFKVGQKFIKQLIKGLGIHLDVDTAIKNPTTVAHQLKVYPVGIHKVFDTIKNYYAKQGKIFTTLAETAEQDLHRLAPGMQQLVNDYHTRFTDIQTIKGNIIWITNISTTLKVNSEKVENHRADGRGAELRAQKEAEFLTSLKEEIPKIIQTLCAIDELARREKEQIEIVIKSFQDKFRVFEKAERDLINLEKELERL